MANSAMYLQKTKVADISAGKIDFEIQVRVINLWTTPDRNNPAEEGAIHMVFLDQDCGKIHATIRKDLIPLFKDQIREGCVYVFERFMVAKNDVAFRSTLHKHKLNFMRRTKVFRIAGTGMPQNHFDFMPFEEILSKTNGDQLLDVIGHVVEKNDMKETEKNGKISKIIDATLEDLEGNRVHCTLWDDYALLMQRFLDTHDPSLPVVIIIQLCKLKKYLGVMGISNAFYGTKLFFNADIPEVTDYVERMNVANVELTQVLSQVSGPPMLSIADDLLQTRRMTIEDLIESTEGPNSGAYPHELNVFVNKRMLFKVEVTDANLFRNWRGYAVKKLSSDEEIINRFTTLYGINLGDDGNHVLVDDASLVDLEGEDSTCNKVLTLLDGVATPTSKLAKASASNIDGVGSPAAKESESLSKSLGKRPVGRKLTIVDDCDASVAKEIDSSSIPVTNSIGKPSAGQKGVNTSFAKNLDPITGEPSATTTTHIPPPNHVVTRSIGKKLSNLDVFGAASTKESSDVAGEPSHSDPTHSSPAKNVGKRSIDVDGWEIVTPKEPRMSCVKIEGRK
ncbi:replication protein A 70 kDa DNA-binding subunit [Trifolium repens]|nr:replication protein A 70 kDa DNA-binding subunit [Trifolium repens]